MVHLTLMTVPLSVPSASSFSMTDQKAAFSRSKKNHTTNESNRVATIPSTQHGSRWCLCTVNNFTENNTFTVYVCLGLPGRPRRKTAHPSPPLLSPPLLSPPSPFLPSPPPFPLLPSFPFRPLRGRPPLPSPSLRSRPLKSS